MSRHNIKTDSPYHTSANVAVVGMIPATWLVVSQMELFQLRDSDPIHTRARFLSRTLLKNSEMLPPNFNPPVLWVHPDTRTNNHKIDVFTAKLWGCLSSWMSWDDEVKLVADGLAWWRLALADALSSWGWLAWVYQAWLLGRSRWSPTSLSSAEDCL